jgi:hypothetical protein
VHGDDLDNLDDDAIPVVDVERGHGSALGYLRHLGRAEPGCPSCRTAWQRWLSRHQASTRAASDERDDDERR